MCYAFSLSYHSRTEVNEKCHSEKIIMLEKL